MTIIDRAQLAMNDGLGTSLSCQALIPDHFLILYSRINT